MKDWPVYGIGVIVLGSIFMVSRAFMDTFHSAKCYWLVCAVLSMICLKCMVQSKWHKIDFSCGIVRWGILFVVVSLLLRVSSWTVIFSLILYMLLLFDFSREQKVRLAEWLFGGGCLQVVYYLASVLQLLPTGEMRRDAGSFDNIAGLVCTLVLLLPLGFFLVKRYSGHKRWCIWVGIGIMISAILISGSRTAIVAAGIVVMLNISGSYLRGIIGVVILVAVIGIGVLSVKKADSGKGRLLIYQVAGEMMKRKPLTGYGKGGFQLYYMPCQAEYLQRVNGKERQLADNVKHPFNEFLWIGVEFGICGLIVWGLLLFKWMSLVRRSVSKYRLMTISALFALGVCACFSYPLHYITVWLLLLFYVSFLFPLGDVVCYSRKMRGSILLLSLCLLAGQIKTVGVEIQWKQVADSCLKGKTVKMLVSYEMLYPFLKDNTLFLYNYAAELNTGGQYEKSVEILQEYKKKVTDYESLKLMADNYFHLGNYSKAECLLQECAHMIPCRFWPLYQSFLIYRKTGDTIRALKMAEVLVDKKVKIESYMVSEIQNEAREYISSIHFPLSK